MTSAAAMKARPADRFAKMLPSSSNPEIGGGTAALQLPGPDGSAAGQLTAALVQALRERQERAQALAGAARTAVLVEATPALKALSFHPHLLRLLAGDAVGAVAAYEELLMRSLRLMGPAHPHNLSVRENLARWQRRLRGGRW
ncbi:hypothetical protein [Streptomyces sp. NPDC001056]